MVETLDIKGKRLREIKGIPNVRYVEKGKRTLGNRLIVYLEF